MSDEEEAPAPPLPCCLCGICEDDQLRFGQLFKLDDIAVHHFCLLFSDHLAQNGKDDEGAEGFLSKDIKALKTRVAATICCHCEKGGATTQCTSIKCSKKYHIGCAVKANALLQFFGKFKSFCEEHRPRQNVIGGETGEPCSICLDATDPADQLHVLWTPCCKHFFHRSCLQRMAYHFGYFFYCPGCRNKDTTSGFLKHMKHFGIFIPKRDASWEMVPNAFGELLERHLMCDVRYCLCVMGRQHQASDVESPWRLCVCETCGSQGTHLACSSLPPTTARWVCPACSLQPAPAVTGKCSLRAFFQRRPAAAGEASSSGVSTLSGSLSLRELLSELEEPEQLVRFTISPISGLAVVTRRLCSERVPMREPGGRPVQYHPLELLPETTVTREDQRQAQMRLWSENHVAAPETGGRSSYEPAQHRPPTAGRRRLCRAQPAASDWTLTVAAYNHRPPEAGPSPAPATASLAGLPPTAELRAALAALHCPSCQQQYKLLSELTYHYQSHSGDALFFCKLCHERTSQWGSYHVMDVHPELPVEDWAQYVDSTFERAQALMIRLLLKRRGVHVTLDQARSIHAHFRVLVGGKGAGRVRAAAAAPPAEVVPLTAADVYQCPECGAVILTVNKEIIAKHKFFHSDEAVEQYSDRENQCNHCHFASQFPYQLRRHQQRHHQRRPALLLTQKSARPRSGTPRPPSAAAAAEKAAGAGAGSTEVSSSGIHECKDCGKIIVNTTKSSMGGLALHRTLHSQKMRHAKRHLYHHCPKCYFASNLLGKTMRHMQHVHDMTPVRGNLPRCKRCGQPTPELKRHQCRPPVTPGAGAAKAAAVRSAGAAAAAAADRPVERATKRPPADPPAERAGTPLVPGPMLELPADGSLKCPKCGKIAKDEQRFQNHVFFHTAVAQQQMRHLAHHCPKCFYASEQSVRVQQHLVRHHQVNAQLWQRTCDTCAEVTFDLARHLCRPAGSAGAAAAAAAPTDAQPAAAEQSSPSKAAHFNVVKPVICRHCGKVSRNEHFAKKHAYYHTQTARAMGKALPEHCPLCFFADTTVSRMKKHLMKTHGYTEEKLAQILRVCHKCKRTTYNTGHHCKGVATVPVRAQQSEPPPSPPPPAVPSFDPGTTERVATQAEMEAHPLSRQNPLMECNLCGCSEIPYEVYKKHIFYHSATCREQNQHCRHHCPKCFFASNHFEVVSQHVAMFHKLDVESLTKLCSDCGLRTLDCSRHRCGPPPIDDSASCAQCGLQGSPADLKRHAYWHSAAGQSVAAISPWTCPLCFFSSNVSRKVRDHIEDDHRLEPTAFQSTCAVCNGMVFNRAAHQHWHGLAPAERADCGRPVYDAPARPVGSLGLTEPVVVPVSALMASAVAESRRDCPFCDDFFHSRAMYVRHMNNNHKATGGDGAQLPDQCRYKYCVVTSDNMDVHEMMCHKDGEYRHRCGLCDAVFHRESDRWKHMESRHADREGGNGIVTVAMTGHCWCTTDEPMCLDRLNSSKQHLLKFHSVLIRGYPGPRKELYTCPQCSSTLPYHELICHMASQHNWPFKITGQAPSAESATSQPAKRSQKKLRCPVCQMCFDFKTLHAHLKTAHKWTFLQSKCDERLSASKRMDTDSQKAPKKSAPTVLANKLLKRAIGLPASFRFGKPAAHPAPVASVAGGGGAVARYDCAFCDAFFVSGEEYRRHSRHAHSGMHVPDDPEQACPVQFCYLPAFSVNGHRPALHKNPDRRVIRCTDCGSSYNSRYHMERHRNSVHRQPRPAIRLLGDVECRCDMTEARRRKHNHVWTYHCEDVRTGPGPRSEPYVCPECNQRLQFAELTQHLQTAHRWRLKTQGSVVLRVVNNDQLPTATLAAVASQQPGGPAGDAEFEELDDSVDAGMMASPDTEMQGLLGTSHIKHEATDQEEFCLLMTEAVKEEPMVDGPLQLLPAPEQQLQLPDDGRGSWVGWSASDPERLDCPFCDSFFHGRHGYVTHMERVHSGMPNTMNSSTFRVGTCHFKFCYCQGTHAHSTQYHKGADDCTFVCDYCDRRYRTSVLCQGHMRRMHSSLLESSAHRGDRSQCRCDKIDQKMVHLVRNHSIEVRGFPGPRARPYACPKCPAKMDFHALVRHLKGVHHWRIKETGQTAYGGADRAMATLRSLRAAEGQRRPGQSADEDDDNAAMLQFESGALNELEDEVGPEEALDVAGPSTSGDPSTIPPVFPCPFCDAFFLHKWEYRSHMLDLHSGMKESKGCAVAFCYGTNQTLHLSRMHKSAESMRHSCPKCDATFQSSKLVVKHVNRTHRPNVNTSMTATTGAEAQFATLCSCDVCPRFSHIQICHSVAVRGEPGPRAEPYECPECEEQLRFSALLIHLSQQHGWRLKFHGEKAFRASHSQPDSGSSAMFHQNQHDTPTETRRSPTFVCHFCPYSGPRFEVRDHEKSQHIEEISAFKAFAATCIPAETQMYVCPFCTYNSGLIWSFHQHLVKSEFCRSYLDAGAQVWAVKSRAMKGPPPVFGGKAGAAAKPKTSPQKAAAPPSKPQATSGSLQVKMFANTMNKGNSILHKALITSKLADTGKRRFIFKCHFCPETFSIHADVIRHQMFEHREPYMGFLEFARVCKRGVGPEAMYVCPNCSAAFPKNKVWKLRDHFFKSARCTGILSPENYCWLEAPPPEEDDVKTVAKSPTATVTSAAAAAAVAEAEAAAALGTSLDPPPVRDVDGLKRVYPCHFCSLKFGSTNHVIQHQENEHGEAYKSYRKFSERSRHPETREFVCRYCKAKWHSNKAWALYYHFRKSPACRNRLDYRTHKWLKRPAAKPSATAVGGFKTPVFPPVQLPKPTPTKAITLPASPAKYTPAKPQPEKTVKPRKEGLTYKCYFCAFVAHDARTARTKHMTRYHGKAYATFMRFSDSCRNSSGMFECPVCHMSKTHDRRWELRDHFFVYNQCAMALPPEADVWLSKTSEVVGGHAELPVPKKEVPTPKKQPPPATTIAPSVITVDNLGSVYRRSLPGETAAAAAAGVPLSRYASDVSEAGSQSGGETALGRKASEESDRDAPVEPGARRKRKAPDHWQAGGATKQMTLLFMCHFCSYSNKKKEVAKHEDAVHMMELQVYMSFMKYHSDMNSVAWCPYCGWSSHPDRRWMLRKHILESESCRAQLPPSEHCWLSEGDPNVRAAVTEANRNRERAPTEEREWQEPPSRGVQRNTDELPEKPRLKLVFRCHYCPFSSNKGDVQRHQQTEHAEAHLAFTSFAEKNKLGSKVKGMRCPFCPWVQRCKSNIWTLMDHIAESPACQELAGPRAQSWISTIQPSAKLRSALPRGEEVLIPAAAPDAEALVASDLDEDDPLQPVPDADPLAVGGADDPLSTEDDALTAVAPAPPAGGGADLSDRCDSPGSQSPADAASRAGNLRCQFCSYTANSRPAVYKHRRAQHAYQLSKFDEFCNATLNKTGHYFSCPFCSFLCRRDRQWQLHAHIVQSASCRSQLGSEHDCWFQTSDVAAQRAEAAHDRPLTMFEPQLLQRRGDPAAAAAGAAAGADLFQCCYCAFEGTRPLVREHQHRQHAEAQARFLEFAATRRGADRAYSCPHCLYKTMLARSFLRHFSLLSLCREKLGAVAVAWTATGAAADDDDDIILLGTPEPAEATGTDASDDAAAAAAGVAPPFESHPDHFADAAAASAQGVELGSTLPMSISSVVSLSESAVAAGSAGAAEAMQVDQPCLPVAHVFKREVEEIELD